MTNSAEHDHLSELVELWTTATQTYLNGDLIRYAELVRHSDDYTLIPPNGGDPRHGFNGSPEAVEWTTRTFVEGTAELEVFGTYSSGNLAVLVAVEHQEALAAPLPRQEWSMRVTLVFRREDDTWRLIHRHADPLTRPLDPPVFAGLARGDYAAS